MTSLKDSVKALHKYLWIFIIILIALLCSCQKKEYFDSSLAGEYEAFSGECVFPEIEIGQEGAFSAGDIGGHILTQESNAVFYSEGKAILEAEYLIDDMFLELADTSGNTGTYISCDAFDGGETLKISGRYISQSMSAVMDFQPDGAARLMSLPDGKLRKLRYVYSKGIIKLTYEDDMSHAYYFLGMDADSLVFQNIANYSEIVFLKQETDTLPQGEYSMIYYGAQLDIACSKISFSDRQGEFEGSRYELLSIKDDRAYFLYEGKLYDMRYEADYPNISILGDDDEFRLTDLSALTWSALREDMAGVYVSADLQTVLTINCDGTINLTIGCIGADFNCLTSANIMKLECEGTTLYYDFACDEGGIYMAQLPRGTSLFNEHEYLTKIR